MIRVVFWLIACVWLGVLPLQSWAQEPQGETEKRPVCPERPFYHPRDEEVAETGLSPEVLCIIGDTYLMRHDIPGPEESPDLLRRFVRRGPYEKLSDAQYLAVMEEAVRLWPKSHYAHEGLADALLGGHGAQGDPAVKRRAANELLIAAEIAFNEGKVVLYVTRLAQLLADLGDKTALDNYFKRVFELIPEGGGRYFSYLHYAQALAKLDDERAETYFRKAIQVRPELEDTYEFYGRYLLDHGKAQAVLDLLAPGSQAERTMYKPVFQHQRCQALKQLGRERECLQADGQTSPGTPSPPSSGSGPSASIALSDRALLARILGSGLAYAAHDNPVDEAGGEPSVVARD